MKSVGCLTPIGSRHDEPTSSISLYSASPNFQIGIAGLIVLQYAKAVMHHRIKPHKAIATGFGRGFIGSVGIRQAYSKQEPDKRKKTAPNVRWRLQPFLKVVQRV